MVFKKVIGFSMVAVMAASAFTSVAAHKESEEQRTNAMQQGWLHDGQGSPTDPESYVPGDLSDCEGTAEVCGIIAPEGEPGKPEIVEGSDLYNRIQAKDPSQNDVFLMD